MGTWPYKNCLYSSEVERPKELPVSSQRWLVCKRIPSKSLTLFFLWKVHLAAIEAEAVAFPWSFLCLIFAIQPPAAPFTLLLNVMHFLNCLEKLVSLRSPALNLYFTLLWRIPPVYCKGYYLESLPWKFTKGQSQGKKKSSETWNCCTSRCLYAYSNSSHVTVHLKILYNFLVASS